jgi:hypothetical protein
MPSTIKCLNCGAILAEPVGPCKQCGGPIELAVSLTGVECKAVAGQVGTVNDGSTSVGGRHISYTAPTGARSDASLVGSRLVIQVKPPMDVGTRGESRVLACVVANLAMAGKSSTLLPADDQAGEDRILQIAGDRVILQIVTATPDASFWNRVAKGAAEAHAELPEAAGWIDTAISEKARLYPSEFKSCMLLAVDVGHMGVLADSALSTHYLQTYSDPTIRHGFGGVWLVGPTENNVLRLGGSRW